MFERLFSKPQESKSKLEGQELFQQILKEAELVKIDGKRNKNSNGELLAEDGSPSHLPELYWKIVRTPSFKEWFGNSVVRNDNGEPKVVYRASIDKVPDITPEVTFRPNAQEWKTAVPREERHLGIFFTSKRDKAIDWFKTQYLDRTEPFWYHENKEDRVFDSPEEEKEFNKDREEFLKKHEDQIRVTAAFIKLKNPFIEKGHTPQQAKSGLVSIGDFRKRYDEGGEFFEKKLRRDHDGLYIPTSSDYGDEYTVVKNENIFILPSDIETGKFDHIIQTPN